jgi:hypothetical protein
MSTDHRLCEIIPVKTLQFEGPYKVNFINWAKNIETRIVDTRKEALELYNIWMNDGQLPEKPVLTNDI